MAHDIVPNLNISMKKKMEFCDRTEEETKYFLSHQREKFTNHSGQQKFVEMQIYGKMFYTSIVITVASHWTRIIAEELHNCQWKHQSQISVVENLEMSLLLYKKAVMERPSPPCTSKFSSEGFEEMYSCTWGPSRAPVQFDGGTQVCRWYINTKFSNKICRRCRAKEWLRCDHLSQK